MEESGNQSGVNPHVGEGDLAVQTLKCVFYHNTKCCVVTKLKGDSVHNIIPVVKHMIASKGEKVTATHS